MTKRIDFEKINKDFLEILKKHRITPESYGISLTLAKDDFDAIVVERPELSQHPGIILMATTENSGLQWSLQILRKLDLEDFPLEVVQKPPEGE